MRVLILGDLHGDFENVLNPLIEKEQPDLVLQVGDFGFWGPGLCDRIRAGQAVVRWCDGNHERHPLLTDLRNKTTGYPQAHQVCRNVFWQDRGSTITLEDGRVVLFAGGAWSADFHEREEGLDWFPEEVLTKDDLAGFPDPSKVNVDIVISHTCPTSFEWELPESDGSGSHSNPEWVKAKRSDPSCTVLQTVLERYRPNRWFFGHFHRFVEGTTGKCRWTGVACPSSQDGLGTNWVWL